MPADYRDELRGIHDLIFETQSAPEKFRSFHWMIATNDQWRFADSSAMLGGPFDMSERIAKTTASSFVLDKIQKMLAMSHIYVADIPLPFENTDINEVIQFFGDVEPDGVLMVVASGRKFTDQSGWSLKLVFVGLENAERFLKENEALLATAKLPRGETLYSNASRRLEV